MFQSVDYQTYFGTLIWNLDYYILVLLTIAGMSAIVIWKRREKKLRRLFFWGGGGVVLLLAVGFFWVRQVDLAARKHWNAICQTTAQTYATSFELMEHEKIPSDISAEQTPLFQLLYDACERWQSNNPLIASICTLRKIDDKTYVYILGPPVDYDNDGKYEGDMEDYAPPGTVYKYEGENDPDLVDAITNGELTGSWFPYVFGGSQFLCTSIPMVDSDGVIRSAVMVDFYGDVWIQNVMSARKVPIYATGVFIFVWLGLLVAIVQNRKQEDQRIRIMFDSTPLACHFRDEQSKIVDCNLEAVKLFDLKDKQEYLDRYLDLSPELQPDGERSTEKIDRMVKQVSETGRVVFEWMHCNLNGDLIPSEITFVRTKRGDSFTVAGYTRDLRKLKKTEEERKRYAENLEKAKIEAENANKAKSEFLAHMSHEIRTPLNGVIGLSDLLLGTKMNGKQYEYAELINSSGRSLLFLINDILDFSKIEAGKLEIDSEAFDLPVTVESVLGILASRADDKGLDLGVFFRSGVPRIVQGDSGRLRQILLNLVGNAIKFTERGGVRIDVAVEAVRETGVSVRFEVSDTGIGIPEDRLDRLFKAFSQADTSSARVYGGTGLGLAISMKLVHLMKGEIGVQSTREKGSTFWFTAEFECDAKALECLRNGTGECNAKDCDRVDGEMCNHIAYRGFDKAYDVSGKTVLIVDENEIHRETLQNQLQSWKMNVDVCESGEAAVRFMEQARRKGRPLDLVIFDNTLADGTGIEWARRLLGSERPEEHDRTHGILLRSLGEEYDPDFVRESAMEVVGKPVFTSALFDAVMNQLFADADRKITSEKKATGTTTRRFDVSFGQNIHFLVVEDNRVNQIVVKNLIAEAGLTCDIANNGHEACDAVRNKFYDVILMDCQMPEMDGYEATDLIRKWEHEQAKKRTPIIALTANATKEDIEKCFEAGMDAYCSKPINPGVLFETIHCLVGEILTPNVSAG